MTDTALTTATHGIVRAVLVLAVLIVLTGLVAYYIADKLGRTRHARRGIFLGIGSTGLIFAVTVAWAILRSGG